MRYSSEWDRFFATPGAKRWLTRSRLPRSNALFLRTDRPSVGGRPKKEDYVYSLDPDLLRLTEFVAKRATDAFPVDVRPDGFAGPTAVPGNFFNVLGVSGYGMDPLPLPLLDNAKYARSLGLADRIRPQDAPYLDELIRLFFGAAAPTNLYVRKEANTGFPYFVTDVQYKKMSFLKMVHNVDDFLNSVSGDEARLEHLLETYHGLMLSSINERQQPPGISKKDGRYVPKPRNAPTPQQARSGDFQGGTHANFTVVGQHGEVLEDHFAMRRRTVFGMCGPLNYFGTAVMAAHRSVYLDRFAHTYKVRGPEDKSERVAKYRFVVGSDVKNMDNSLQRWFFDYVLEKLESYWDPRFVEMVRRMLRAPYVVPPPWRKTPEDYDPAFGGSPLNPRSFSTSVGLPSGIFLNPDLGKLFMTFVYVILFRDAGAIYSPTQIEQFLMGRLPGHALMDMADDAAMLTDSERVREHLLRAESPYAVLEPETPVIYLGDVLRQEGNRKDAVPNPLSYVVNMFAREDSIDRKPVSAYADGVMARNQLYSRTPIFRDLNALLEEGFRTCLGFNPLLLARSAARHASFTTDIDAMVRADPAVLHYKVDPNDVSPDVLDEVVSTVPHADFFKQLSVIFNRNTVSLAQ